MNTLIFPEGRNGKAAKMKKKDLKSDFKDVYPWVASSVQAVSMWRGEQICTWGSSRRTEAITWSVTSRGETVLTSSSLESKVFTERRFAATPDAKGARVSVAISFCVAHR